MAKLPGGEDIAAGHIDHVLAGQGEYLVTAGAEVDDFDGLQAREANGVFALVSDAGQVEIVADLDRVREGRARATVDAGINATAQAAGLQGGDHRGVEHECVAAAAAQQHGSAIGGERVVGGAAL